MRLASVAVLLCAAAVSAAMEELPWWKTAILYQVYPRSFKDSNGDGVGDLRGIIEKAPYLRELGITAIWISPIFKSPMADFGYDIADYRSIDPTFGSLSDLVELSKTLKELDIKLLLDLVPNHSSDEHEWFQKSIKKIDPYTDYYVWNDGKVDPKTGERSPPNNWTNAFQGSAWEWNDERKQYYLHQFAIKQPDLNYRNPAVVEEMDNVFLFWLDLGIDGFRVDAVPFLFEDEGLRDEPAKPGTLGDTWESMEHPYTQNQPETYALLRHWADLVYNYTQRDGKPRALFVEAYADLEDTIKYYGHDHQSLMQPFNFQLLSYGNQSSTPQHLKDLIMSWMDKMTDDIAPNWVIGNHDQSRISKKYGAEMVDALNLLTGILPGVKVTYYGEELGMQDTFIRWEETVDVQGVLQGPYRYQERSRDPARTPMQWNDLKNAGFSSSKTTWLPVNPNYWSLNVQAQMAAQSSHLKVFQAMVQARKDPVLLRGDLRVVVPDDTTLLVTRRYKESTFALVINMGSYVADYTTEGFFSPQGLGKDMTVITSSVNSGVKPGLDFPKGSASLSLRPKGAVLLKSRPSN